MLGLVRQVRPAVLHLRDPRVRVARAHPVFVRRFLLPLPVQPRHLLPRRILDPLRLRQSLQILFVLPPVIPPPDRPHRRIGFQRRPIDGHRLPIHQTIAPKHLQHPPEHRLVRLHRVQPASPGHRRMFRRLLAQPQPQKLPQAQTVGHPPGDAPFAIDALHVAHQQHPKEHSRRQTRPAHHRLVVPPAQLLHLPVEPVLVEDLVHLSVVHPSRRGRLNSSPSSGPTFYSRKGCCN